MTNRNRVRLSQLSLGLAIALAAAPAFAQNTTSAVGGRIVGSDSQPVAGAQVTIVHAPSGTVSNATTGADGRYSARGLRVGGPYTITIVKDGVSETREGVYLQLAETTAVDATLGEETTTLAAVEVTGTAVMSEVFSADKMGATTSITREQIDAYASIQRNLQDYARLDPRLSQTDKERGEISAGGQNVRFNSITIDGVTTNDTFGLESNNLPTAKQPISIDAIQSVQVNIANYDVTQKGYTGANINAVTKSGTNEFKGEAFYRYTDEDMRAKTPAERQDGKSKEVSAEKEYGFALGGPIVQDKAHFFVTYEAKRFDLPVTIAPDGAVGGAASLLPADAAAGLGPASQPFEQDLIFAKIDFEPTDNDRIELTFQDRDETQQQFSGQTAPEAGREVVNTDRRYALRWNHSGERYYNEMMVTHEDSFNNPTPLTLANGITYTAPDGTEDRTVVKIGGASALDSQVKGQKGWSIEDNLTLDGIQWAGDHTIKMGVKYKQIDLYASDAAQINPTFTYSLGDADFPSSIPYKAQFVKPVTGVSGVSGEVRSKSKQIGLFIQDDWQVNDHLILNLGVRWDYEKNPAYTDFVTSQAFVDARIAAHKQQRGPGWRTPRRPSSSSRRSRPGWCRPSACAAAGQRRRGSSRPIRPRPHTAGCPAP